MIINYLFLNLGNIWSLRLFTKLLIAFRISSRLMFALLNNKSVAVMSNICDSFSIYFFPRAAGLLENISCCN